MRPAYLPISRLPTWAKLNNVAFHDVAVVENHEHAGYGLAATRALTSPESEDGEPLLHIPRGLMLCVDTIAASAKADRHFGSLLAVAGGKVGSGPDCFCSRDGLLMAGQNLRGDAMLFFLMQVTMATKQKPLDGAGVSGPWTEYVKMLPEKVPLPTTWTDEEMHLLDGTSLEVSRTRYFLLFLLFTACVLRSDLNCFFP